ncbi:MAG TPA: caspase family protein [Geobacteraceae bacterium]
MPLVVALLAGCMPSVPARVDALSALEALPQNSDLKKLTLAVIYSENTRNCLKYVADAKASSFSGGRVDPDDAALLHSSRDLLEGTFGRVVAVKSFDEARAANAQLVAIVDMYAKIGSVSFTTTSFDMTFDFRGLNKEPIAVAKGEGSGMVPYPAFTLRWDTSVATALQGLTTALTGNAELKAFAARVAPTLVAAAPVSPLNAGGNGRNQDQPAAIVSDIDVLPPVHAKPNHNAYAIVIGIESYRQKLPKAEFAASDARIVTSYLTKVLGYPEENVVTLINDHATKSDIEKYMGSWLRNNIDRDSTLFVYYSGHGAPNPKTGDAYLVPYDGDPTFIADTGYSLKKLYSTLNRIPARQIIVALDSCFSGAGGKSVAAPGSRALVRAEKAAIQNTVVMTASADDQISSTYQDKGHGIFTYFLLRGIKEKLEENRGGGVEIGALFDYLKPQVERVSRKVYNSEQTPELLMTDIKMRALSLN